MKNKDEMVIIEGIFAKFGCSNCVALPNGPGWYIPGIWKCNEEEGRYEYDLEVVEANKEYFSEDYNDIMRLNKYKKD